MRLMLDYYYYTLYTTNFTEPLSYQDSAFLKLPKFPQTTESGKPKLHFQGTDKDYSAQESNFEQDKKILGYHQGTHLKKMFTVS